VIACGIDVSARRGHHLCTLRPGRGGRLVATFHAPADARSTARAVLAQGAEAVVAVDAPSGPRRDLLGPGAPLRAALALPDGRYERFRVCDAVLYRRGLPLYPVPARGEPVPTWMAAGFGVYGALRRRIPLYRPPRAAACEAPIGRDATRHGRLVETYPDAVFCALLGHRPPAKRTAAGRAARIAALVRRGVMDRDGELWQRTLDELDACAAACAAHALAQGSGCWVGDPREGVVVLPVVALRSRYVAPGPPGRVGAG